jgi:hypothetical protein
MPAFNSLTFLHCSLEFGDCCYIPLHRLTYLEITKCTFQTYDVLMGLFSGSCCLEKLLIDSVQVLSRRLDQCKEAVILPKLRDLELYAGMVRTVLPFLAPPPTLRDVRFNILGVEELFIIREYLDDIAPDLNSFTVWYGGWGGPKDIGVLPAKLTDVRDLTILQNYVFKPSTLKV